MSSPAALGAARPPALDMGTSPSRQVPVIDRNKVNPEVLKAAEGMEAMFIDHMLKVMRESVPKNEMDLESPASGIYRSMMDSEVANRAAKAGGIGLADQIIAYYEQQKYTLPKGIRAESAIGGNHEGQPDGQ